MPTPNSAHGDSALPERGWTPSPGQWTAPEGKRAGKDWVPPGGAAERLDRMPWWVRAWSRPPLRALGQFEVWLWQHGGYDVEGPDATLERERLTAQYEAQYRVIEAALDRPGPWPATSTVRTQNVEIVDVDRYDDLAIVTAAVAEEAGGGGPMLRASVFRREHGTWRWLGGGGTGSGSDPLIVRQELGDNDRGLNVASRGWHGPRQRGGSKPACDAMLLCSPGVSSVSVDRSNHRRVADLGTGPGWIGIVWPEGSEPSVSAFDAAGKQVAVLEPNDLRYNSRSQHWPFGVRGRLWFGWRLGRKERGWFNYQPRR